MFAQFAARKRKKWDAHIAEFCFAYNTPRSESTGFSPAYLNSRHELDVPGGTVTLGGSGLPLET